MSSNSTSSSRRAVLGSAFTIVSAQAVRGSQANSRVSFGLIGSGGRGTFDAKVVSSDPRAQVTALCDLFPDRIESAKSQLQLTKVDTYQDYQKLLANSSIDAVIIATPPFEHPPMLEAAVASNKHIYCEKPMGVDAEGCKRVIAAGKKLNASKCLSVGFQQRYGPVYIEAYNRLTSGQLGELATARGYWIANDPFTRRDYPGLDPKMEKLRNWFCYKDLSGDFIVEQDCHNFDVLHWFLNSLPVSAVGYGGRKIRTSMDLMDNLSLAFQFPNNIIVNFEADQLTPRGYAKVGEEFTGTKGTIVTSRGKMTHYKGPNDVETIDSKRDITYDAFEQFITRILNNNPENVSERSALSTMIALLGRTALYTRKEATWKGTFGA
jgi:myo-inositol 2-dehydrogenase / D-chiro-inositol 1-dehydrogenase